MIGKCYAYPSATRANKLKRKRDVDEERSKEEASVRKQKTSQVKDQVNGLTEVSSAQCHIILNFTPD
jgi:hypothetical protein